MYNAATTSSWRMPGAPRIVLKPRTCLPPRSESARSANAPPVRPTATAAVRRTVLTPPTASSAGTSTAPSIPPSGTAICRTPSAHARRSTGYARKSAPTPATVTTDDPTPKTASAIPRPQAVSATAATASATGAQQRSEGHRDARPEAVDRHSDPEERQAGAEKRCREHGAHAREAESELVP